MIKIFAFLILITWPASLLALTLPTNAVVVVHASRHYHSDEHTIASTNEILSQARFKNRMIIALAQNPTKDDPQWYAERSNAMEFYSHHGESDLVPSQSNFEVTFVGGYHSACLGWAMAEMISRFVRFYPGSNIRINLPMEAIFTGFKLDSHMNLKPHTPEEEANADDSVDGLNLFEVTKRMNNPDWKDFIIESLRWAIFKKQPVMLLDKTKIKFQVFKDNRFITEISEGIRSPLQTTIELRY